MLFGIDSTNTVNDIRDRFDMTHFMEFTNGWFDSMNSEFINWLLTAEPDGWYRVVEPQGRPDLVSYHIYGDTQYWWILLLINDIICVNDLKENMEIKYIRSERLQNKYLDLDISSRANV